LFQIGTQRPIPTFALLSTGESDWRVVTTHRVGFRTYSVNGTVVLRRMGLSVPPGIVCGPWFDEFFCTLCEDEWMSGEAKRCSPVSQAVIGCRAQTLRTKGSRIIVGSFYDEPRFRPKLHARLAPPVFAKTFILRELKFFVLIHFCKCSF